MSIAELEALRDAVKEASNTRDALPRWAFRRRERVEREIDRLLRQMKWTATMLTLMESSFQSLSPAIKEEGSA